jgi:hypothetical protein
MMMNVMLANCGRALTSDVTGRDAAPDTKACARGEQASAGGARAFWFTVRSQVLRGGRIGTGHALDRFDRCRYRLGIRFWPTEVAWEALKEFFDVRIFDRLVFF